MTNILQGEELVPPGWFIKPSGTITKLELALGLQCEMVSSDSEEDLSLLFGRTIGGEELTPRVLLFICLAIPHRKRRPEWIRYMPRRYAAPSPARMPAKQGGHTIPDAQ